MSLKYQKNLARLEDFVTQMLEQEDDDDGSPKQKKEDKKEDKYAKVRIYKFLFVKVIFQIPSHWPINLGTKDLTKIFQSNC